MNNQSHTLQLSERPQNIAAGIGLMLLAILLFSVNDVAGKWLAASYSAPQILLFRSVAALVLLLPILAWTDGFGALFSMPRPGLQLLRAGLAAAETGLFYWSVSYLPLADAMTYYLAGPIYVTLIAVLFLGERVGWRRWAAVIAGFAGVVIALGPSAGSFGWPVFIAFGGSIIYAVFLAMTRVLRGTSDIVMATWQIVASLVIGIVGTPFSYVPIATWSDGAFLAMLGVVALVAIVCINRSLKLAPASVVVPYQYSIIIWAIIFGYLVFGDVPRFETLIGAAIIIAAGLFIFFREQKIGKRAATELATGPE